MISNVLCCCFIYATAQTRFIWLVFFNRGLASVEIFSVKERILWLILACIALCQIIFTFLYTKKQKAG